MFNQSNQANHAQAMGTLGLIKTNDTPRQAYTPAHHASISSLRPCKLLSLGHGPYGKTALFEFDGGFQRTMDFTCPADAWHPTMAFLTAEDAYRLEHHTATHTFQADGTVKVNSHALPYVSSTIDQQGKETFNGFDVPAEDFETGCITGQQMALKMFALADDREDLDAEGLNIKATIISAVQALAHSGHNASHPSQRGAAVGFLETIANAVWFAIPSSIIAAHTEKRIAQAQQAQKDNLAQEKAEQAQRIKRTIKARKAKHEAKHEATIALATRMQEVAA